MGCGASRPGDVAHAAAPEQPTGGTMPLTAAGLKPWRHGSSISVEAVARQREEFWETRTSGQPMIWNALKAAAEAVLAGDFDHANAVLTATNIMTPRGTLELAYDELGTEYKVPQVCFSDPMDVDKGQNSAAAMSNRGPVQDRELVVHVRIYPGEHKLTLETRTGRSVLELKEQITEASRADESCPEVEPAAQRMLFMGKELRDTQSVFECGLDGERVVQVYLRRS